jgi:hypothetical protein
VRGDEVDQGHMFSYVSAEKRVPADHPLRRVRKLVDTALEKLSKDFDQLYADTGRPSIPPERLLRASVDTSKPATTWTGKTGHHGSGGRDWLVLTA